MPAPSPKTVGETPDPGSWSGGKTNVYSIQKAMKYSSMIKE